MSKLQSLLDLDTQEILSEMVKETNYGYVLITEDFHMIMYSDFVRTIFPQIPLIQKGDSVVDFQPFMREVFYYEENGEDQHRRQEHGMLLDCKISRRNYRGLYYYFIEWWDETIKYEIMNADTKYIEQLNQDVRDTIDEVYRVQSSIVEGMATMVESRDNSTGGHVMRVSLGVSVLIEKLRGHLNLRDTYWENIRKAAPLHDIGKIAVDDDILRKPGRFTAEEFDFMKKHTTQGAYMLERILSDVNDEEFLNVAVNIAKYHHEKYDGTGYPEGLAGDAIPFEARVLALADVFDALVCRRVYKDAFDYSHAFAIIEEEMGKQFDPFLCAVFLDCKQELTALYDSLVKE